MISLGAKRCCERVGQWERIMQFRSSVPAPACFAPSTGAAALPFACRDDLCCLQSQSEHWGQAHPCKVRPVSRLLDGDGCAMALCTCT